MKNSTNSSPFLAQKALINELKKIPKKNKKKFLQHLIEEISAAQREDYA